MAHLVDVASAAPASAPVLQDTQIPPIVQHMKKKKKKYRGIKPADPAANVTIGFDMSPATSRNISANTSAVSTPMLGPRSISHTGRSASPSTRESSLTRAISDLRLNDRGPTSVPFHAAASPRLDPCDTGSDHGPKSPLSNESPMPLDELHSEEDSRPQLDRRISGLQPEEDIRPKLDRTISGGDRNPRSKPLLRAIEGGLRHDSPHRKMSAADFEQLKCLGKGTYGTVLLVKQTSTGRLFAQKQLKKKFVTEHKRLIEQTKSERAILESASRHPFVVKLYYAFQDHQKLYLIIEYAQGGELFHHLQLERMFSEPVASFYMAEMILALDYLHRNVGVVYRDLKPENCLLDSEGHLLLTDFGLSKIVKDDDGNDSESSRCSSMLGTVDYMAPEVITGKPYDASVDYWSLGALGFDLLTGAPPFASNNDTKTQQKIVHGKATMPYFLSPDAKDILTRLLRKEPRKRLGGNMPKDMITLRAHRFFRRIDWTALEKREVSAPIQPIITDPAAAENFAAEFTGLSVSPVDARGRLSVDNGFEGLEMGMGPGGKDPFGGFSFVGSRSLLDSLFVEELQ